MVKFLQLSVILLLVANLSCTSTVHKEDIALAATVASAIDPISKQETAAKEVGFAITAPKAGQQVGANVITVKGVGAKQGDSVRIQVMTNDWYVQNGTPQINTDGNWSYSPCYLSGQGQYRLHHSIKAELVRKGKVVATSTVDEIKGP